MMQASERTLVAFSTKCRRKHACITMICSVEYSLCLAGATTIIHGERRRCVRAMNE